MQHKREANDEKDGTNLLKYLNKVFFFSISIQIFDYDECTDCVVVSEVRISCYNEIMHSTACLIKRHSVSCENTLIPFHSLIIRRLHSRFA
jgi:hypothetical protein